MPARPPGALVVRGSLRSHLTMRVLGAAAAGALAAKFTGTCRSFAFQIANRAASRSLGSGHGGRGRGAWRAALLKLLRPAFWRACGSASPAWHSARRRSCSFSRTSRSPSASPPDRSTASSMPTRHYRKALVPDFGDPVGRRLEDLFGAALRPETYAHARSGARRSAHRVGDGIAGPPTAAAARLCTGTSPIFRVADGTARRARHPDLRRRRDREGRRRAARRSSGPQRRARAGRRGDVRPRAAGARGRGDRARHLGMERRDRRDALVGPAEGDLGPLARGRGHLRVLAGEHPSGGPRPRARHASQQTLDPGLRRRTSGWSTASCARTARCAGSPRAAACSTRRAPAGRCG